MDLLTYNGYEGTAEVDIARNVCRGRILCISDLVTYEADTPKELQAEFEAAVDDYLQTCAELGKEPQKPFKGLFNVRVSPHLHKAAALRAVCDQVSLNEVVVQALTAYLTMRTEVNHNVNVTFKGEFSSVQTVPASVSQTQTQWVTSNVH